MTKTYAARSWGNVFVLEDGQTRSLPPRLDLHEYALGYGWGYLGGGSRQLAFALLCDVFDVETAERLHEQFAAVLAKIHRDGPFEITDDDVRLAAAVLKESA